MNKKHLKKEKAKQYVYEGLPIFPVHSVRNGTCTCGDRSCDSAGKHPRVEGGFKAATDDIDQIEQWLNRWPDMNIGLATGNGSGIVVIDVDGKTGRENLMDFVKSNSQCKDSFLEAAKSKTGKGFHYFFRMPDEVQLKSKTDFIAEQIDVRAEGGYVILPPSDHQSGDKYEWERELIGRDLPEVPDLFISDQNDDNAQEEQGSESGENEEEEHPWYDQIITVSDLGEVVPMSYRVEHLIREGSLGMFFGLPGHFKSFAGMDLACAIASGSKFLPALSSDESFEPFAAKQGNVVYLDFENGRRRLRERFNALDQFYEVEDDQWRAISHPRPGVTLMDEDSVDHLIQFLEADNTEFLVVDTFGRAIGGEEDLSSYGPMMTAMNFCHRIIDRTGVTLLLIHHQPKNDPSILGSVGIEGSLDFAFHFSKESDNFVKIENKKQRDVNVDTIGANFYYENRQTSDGRVLKEARFFREPLDLDLSSKKREARELIFELAPQKMNQTDIANAIEGIGRNTVLDTLEIMVEEDELRLEEGDNNANLYSVEEEDNLFT